MRIAAFLDHWRNRPPHERWLIGVPLAALVAVIAYLGIVEPLLQAGTQLARSLPAIEVREARIRAQAADVRAHPVAGSNAVSRAGNSQAIVTATQAAIERHLLRAASPTVDRADDARVRVAFARVPFHAVWPLFQDLQSQLGIRVVALRVDRIDSTLARVEATLASGEAR